MTRDDIKALVCELFEFGEDKFFDYEDEFVRFAALVAEREREECAKVCENLPKKFRTELCPSEIHDCAESIRARSEK